MNFALTPDQTALREAVARFCDSTYPAQTRGQPETSDQCRQHHTALADLGLLGLALPEAHGGSALGATEAMLVAQELGRALASGTWLASHTLVGALVAEAGSADQQDRWLGPLVGGQLTATLACHEAEARHELASVRTRAVPAADGRGWLLSGSKSLVLAGDTAQLLLVCARTAGETTDAHGLSLFALDHREVGLRIQAFQLLDGRGAAHLHLDEVCVDQTALIGPLDGALPLLQAAMARAEAALCAECAGAAEALLAQTCEHLNTRQQFGQMLGKFQALQHKVADLTMALEQMKSMACVAALALDAETAAERDRLIAAARCLSAQLSRRVALDAIQLNGAMGMTDECRASHLAKRLIANGLLFGDAPTHLRRFAAI